METVAGQGTSKNHRLYQGKFWVGLRQIHLTTQVVKHWNRACVFLELGKVSWIRPTATTQ